MPAPGRYFRNIPPNRRMAERAGCIELALLAVKVMLPAERGPPSFPQLRRPKDTYRSAEHNANFVPGNKIGELAAASVTEPLRESNLCRPSGLSASIRSHRNSR